MFFRRQVFQACMSLGYLWFRLSYRENSFPFTTGISFPTTVEPTVFAGRCFVSCNFYAGNKKFICVFERRTSCVLSVQEGRVSIFLENQCFCFSSEQSSTLSPFIVFAAKLTLIVSEVFIRGLKQFRQ